MSRFWDCSREETELFRFWDCSAFGPVSEAGSTVAFSTVADADVILVLDQGRIVERGRFGELARAGGLFSRLVAEGGFTEPTEVEAH
ncbi:MAG: hypothetical protein HC774_06255 [Sphingomonadales bacterium]|nr:hypothetical protein [Sphingomonadales bacterium]